MNPRFFTASPETRIRLRDKSIAQGDQVKPHRSDPSIMLVSAQSFTTANGIAWYRVNTEHCTCTCEGYFHRGICRHICRVSYELWLAQQRAQVSNVIPFPAPQIAA